MSVSVAAARLIGGSMGTASYILAGAAGTGERAFGSACHGAGRAMSRHEATCRWSGRTLVDDLAARGILIRSPRRRGSTARLQGRRCRGRCLRLRRACRQGRAARAAGLHQGLNSLASRPARRSTAGFSGRRKKRCLTGSSRPETAACAASATPPRRRGRRDRRS